MELKLLLTDENIEQILNYLQSHPAETKKLIKAFGDELYNVLMSKRFLRKAAGYYQALNSAINNNYKEYYE